MSSLYLVPLHVDVNWLLGFASFFFPAVLETFVSPGRRGIVFRVLFVPFCGTHPFNLLKWLVLDTLLAPFIVVLVFYRSSDLPTV